jgi:hypothetical protein
MKPLLKESWEEDGASCRSYDSSNSCEGSRIHCFIRQIPGEGFECEVTWLGPQSKAACSCFLLVGTYRYDIEESTAVLPVHGVIEVFAPPGMLAALALEFVRDCLELELIESMDMLSKEENIPFWMTFSLTPTGGIEV